MRKTGMGPKRSQAAVGELADAGGSAMLVLGFCGGLDARRCRGK